MTTPLAHSAGRGVSGQEYRDHVAGVVRKAEKHAGAAARYHAGGVRDLVHVVRAAADRHDLGKLIPENQRILAGSQGARLPVNHVDAGVASLLTAKHLKAAVLAYGHHRGLCSLPGENTRGSLCLRDEEVASRINLDLQSLESAHTELLGARPDDGEQGPAWSSLSWRLALSCLVDADHTDTAAHYLGRPEDGPPAGRWLERLAHLDAYVAGLGADRAGEARGSLRQAIYDACRQADLAPGMYACDSPVGTGKTTAVMAHLLRVAAQNDLRHILVVLPYTNIIQQAVDVYRQALVLPGEAPETVVAEHHHLADFSEPSSRHLATLWRAPIIVTTAVQFFETLASNHTGRLRKLHELPGSAIFLDEAHAAIPAWLWPVAWRWVRELEKTWSCRFVFASGSLVRFWELSQFVDPPISLPELVPAEIRGRAVRAEGRRVKIHRHEQALTANELLSLASSRSGPRLVIMNTVHSAAAIAHVLKKRGASVLHVSTALCPRDRAAIVARVRRWLDDKREDWFLIATSCVEAGMDFSFRSCLRESASAASLIQVSGRVNRHGSDTCGEVLDFRLLGEEHIRRHPGLEISRQALDRLFRQGIIHSSDAADTVTEGMKLELRLGGIKSADRLRGLEDRFDFPAVTERFRVVEGDTRTVLVDDSARRALVAGRHLTPREVQWCSVQIWESKTEKLGLEPLGWRGEGKDGLYWWPHSYDQELLGYMAGVLPSTVEFEPAART